MIATSPVDALCTAYEELDDLLEGALAACRSGDRELALLLASAATSKTAALDRLLRRAGLLPDDRPRGAA